MTFLFSHNENFFKIFFKTSNFFEETFQYCILVILKNSSFIQENNDCLNSHASNDMTTLILLRDVA